MASNATVRSCALIRFRPPQIHDKEENRKDVEDTTFAVVVIACEEVAQGEKRDANDEVCYP